MKRATLYKIITFLIRHLTVAEFERCELVPPQGGLIMATNHMSRLDIPLLFVNPPRPDLTALVTTKYLKYPLIKWFTIAAEGIWLDRDTADFTAFRTALQALKDGKAVGIAPEGTRSQNAALLQGKPGMILLAMKANVPIVPVALTGTEDAVKKLLSFRRPRMKAVFGKPFILPPIDRANRDAELQRLTDEVMCRIAAMMPAKYHGFYAGHPRLQELLASGDF